MSLQIGVNFANDYSDGIRGTDDHRVGPARLTASRKVDAARGADRRADLLRDRRGRRARAGDPHASSGGCSLVGAACIVAAWFYTGGKRPYGYYGLGELFVFVFFGLVATVGTTCVQVLAVPQEAWFGAVGAGLLACAVLLANNLRDIDQDRAAHKRTLTVLIGRRATRVLFTVFVLAPFAIAGYLALFYPIAWLTLLALLAALPAILIVWTYRVPRELVVALEPHVADVGRLRRVPVLGVRRLMPVAACSDASATPRRRVAESSTSSSADAPPCLGAPLRRARS